MKLKAIAFDVFGTVFDVSNVPVEEKRDYIKQVKTVPWQPLVLPESWKNIPPHSDSVEGINMLKNNFKVVTCSNLPSSLLRNMSKNAGIVWNHIIPLELIQKYKPSLETYMFVCDWLEMKPEEVLMVTGNEGSPDLIYPKEIGMNVQRIRAGYPNTIIELAEMLGYYDKV